jgi:competence ComEA-like helix-hairpin-helix protein
MSTPDADSSLLPARSQPLVALAVAIGLAAMAAWYVAAGGLQDRLVHHDAPPAPSVRFTVNINTAPAAELAQLPGLGPALASRIVDHRLAHGPFETLDALLDVPGIGPATLEAMRPHLRPPRRRTAAGPLPVTSNP